ncbi:hypothetical protein INT46_009235 [Mucor plumbeus]|uniref:Glutamyl-tRNA(Gln) amidotransferase subunit F, mitochondrial n=1 Tax=Mucor plumbeus TaxID=97098 RepID=A0A8H7V1V1_9FUNG|nr:hypothetical protein INT46_009235 [Mucor plumbeus]
MFRVSRQISRRLYSTKVTVDEYCLPLKPKWSIKSLLQSETEPISDKQFKHLLNLTQLSIQDKQHEMKLKAEIDQLTQFTDNIKKWDATVDKPLTHIWKEDVGQILRDDNKIESTKEMRGRDLLQMAQKKSGNFYVVKGSMPSSE